MSEHPERLGN